MRTSFSLSKCSSQMLSAAAAALQAYGSVFAICNIGGLSSANILSFLLFWLLYFFYSGTARKISRSALPQYFSVSSAVLALFYTVFYMASEHKQLTGSFDSRLFRLAAILLTSAGLFFLFLACIRMALILLSALKSQAPRPFTRRKWFMIFAGLLLCWLPWFLYNYPGVMTPDSISQFSQITGKTPFSSHHSLIHTMIIGLCYRAGHALTHSVNGGIAFYTVVQMFLLAGTETCCLSLFARRGLPRWLCVCFFLFWGLVPYNAIFAVTMWKDIPFSACAVLYTLLLFQLLEIPKLSWRIHWKQLAGLFFTGWLFCMLRSNGLFAFLFTVPFTIWFFRRQIRVIAPLQLAVLLLALLVRGPVFDSLGVAKPHFTESLSLPLQQVARVVWEGRELTEAQKDLIGGVVDISLIPEYYDPVISDPIKALVIYNNDAFLESHKAEFFRLWVELGMKWPRDYAEAFIDQTRGYWFPAPASLRTNEGISPNEIGLEWPHVLRGMIPIRISQMLLRLPDQLPVYGILWSIGAFTWALLFLGVFQFLYGRRHFLLPCIPFAGIILTLLAATPVASDIRYAYPLILGMPLLLAISVFTRAEH